MSFSAPGIHVPFSDDYFSGTSIACAYVTSQFAYAIVEKGSLDYEELFVKMQNSAVDSSEKSYGVIQMSMLKMDSSHPARVVFFSSQCGHMLFYSVH